MASRKPPRNPALSAPDSVAVTWYGEPIRPVDLKHPTDLWAGFAPEDRAELERLFTANAGRLWVAINVLDLPEELRLQLPPRP